MASFPRNFKRLAGPGFHVNVRFDDAHIRLCRTGSGGADIKNRGFNKTHSSELFDVKEGELLLAKKRSHTRDGFSRCFSSLNGYQVNNLDEDDQEPVPVDEIGGMLKKAGGALYDKLRKVGQDLKLVSGDDTFDKTKPESEYKRMSYPMKGGQSEAGNYDSSSRL